MNPFTRPLPPNPSQLYGGDLAGPITKRASFFMSAERTTIDFRDAVNATVLSASLLPMPLKENLADFEQRLQVSPQLDVTLNKSNSLTARYSFSSYMLPHEGVGPTSLIESGYKTDNRQQTAQISETAVLSAHAADETKFQFLRTSLSSRPASQGPAISVNEAFTTGGSAATLNFLHQRQWEFQNNFSLVKGHHSLRAGTRVRGEADDETVDKNRPGTFLFTAGSGPELTAGNTIMHGGTGSMVIVPISGLERYRRTILFQQQGLSSANIAAMGGGASSFSINGGEPRAQISQYDAGVYLQDNWHMRPNLLLGAGVRYEAQTNLHDRSNAGPRLSAAWAPGAAMKKNPHTVLRGGIGLFYQRLDPTLVLEARHTQYPRWHYTTTDPAILNYFPDAPPPSSLAPYATAADMLQIDPTVRAPATLQLTSGIEQELPGKTRLSASFTWAKTYHDLLLADRLPYEQGVPRYVTVESNGHLTQRQVKVELSNQLSNE